MGSSEDQKSAVRRQFRTLAMQAGRLLSRSDGTIFRSGIAYYDVRKDKRIETRASFNRALDSLGRVGMVQDRYGDPKRLLLQFIYGFLGDLPEQEFDEQVFEHTWESFWEELLRPNWTYFGVTNIQNFDCDVSALSLPEGISIRHRSFDELRELLGWGDEELAFLTSDWMEGHPSQFILLVTQDVPKSKENLVLSNGPDIVSRVMRGLLSLRLARMGDVRIGRIFNGRAVKSHFRLIGGMTTTGQTAWRPGTVYQLASKDVSDLVSQYNQLLKYDTDCAMLVPNVTLALRSFSSLYERPWHQGEDQVVDAITALEALLHLDEELSFKLAYRASSMLGATDDERIAIYETLRSYYKLRSRVVHGSSVSEADRGLIQNNEPLRDVVRRLLRGFLSLVEASPSFRTKRGRESFYGRLDAELLHGKLRDKLRRQLGVDSC